MSMFAAYIKERQNDEMFETDKGFATYRFLNENQVYIVDIYVQPDFRHQKVASELADKIVEIAKSKGCNELIGTVVPSARNSTDSLKVLLGYGMQLQSCTNDFIVFKKVI